MNIHLLGSVEVVVDGRVTNLGPMRGALLAVLALEVRKSIPDQRLIALLWAESPPDGALITLRSHVTRLNKILQATPKSVRIRRSGGGYLLDCPVELIDVMRFREQVLAGRAALESGDSDLAVACLDGALEMWHGEPLSGVPDRAWVEHERRRLTDLREVAVQARIEALLAKGRYDLAIGELRTFLLAHPHEEHVHVQLALALYRDQRADDALDVCRSGIQKLNRNGLNSKLLRDLQNNILNQAPDLLQVQLSTERRAPEQLPPNVSSFTGRLVELDQLRTLVKKGPPDQARKLLISAIAGAGGVGKTALAIRLAHELKSDFPDGQLYVNLHGYDSRQFLSPGQVLDRFLRALGVGDQAIPSDHAERIALLRSMLSGRKVLIVLDNTSSADQVRDLFPSTNTCLVIVTSRDTLGSLIVEDGAHLLPLDVLGTDDAAELLRKMITRTLRPRDEQYIEDIVRLCDGLPLAVRIVGAKIMARPNIELESFCEYLRDERYRLEALNAGDVSVRACFSLSYDSLPRDAQRVFRLLGLIAGPDFSSDGVAALVGGSVVEVRRILDRLADAHLLETSANGERFLFHDLLRLYARERVASEETPSDQRLAVERMLDWYRRGADAASDNIMQTQRMPRDIWPMDPPIDVSTRVLSLRWLETERAGLVAGVNQALDLGLNRQVWELADAQWGFFYLKKHWTDWEATLGSAITAARAAHEFEAESWVLTNLGVCFWDQHKPERAIECFQLALEIASTHGYEACEARDLNGLSLAHRDMEMWPEALHYVEKALPKRRAAGDDWGEAVSLDNRGLILGKLGRTDESIRSFEMALDLWTAVDDHWGHALTLNDMARTLTEAGSFEAAVPHFRESLNIRRRIGDLWGEGESLYYLGIALREIEGDDSARRCWEGALRIMEGLNAREANDIRERLDELS